METHIHSGKESNIPLLVKTATCPACQSVTVFLDKAGFRYDTVWADKTPDTAGSYGVTHVPTMIVKDENGNRRNLVGTDAIRAYVREREAK